MSSESRTVVQGLVLLSFLNFHLIKVIFGSDLWVQMSVSLHCNCHCQNVIDVNLTDEVANTIQTEESKKKKHLCKTQNAK